MKLYNANLSPNCLRVRAVAHELEIELEMIEIDLRAGGTKAEAFLALNANGKVPVLVDGDFTLWESRAITAYLAALAPERGLIPDDPRARAIVDQWSYWQTLHLGPAMQKIAFQRFMKKRLGMGGPDEAAIASELKDVAQFLRVLEANLATRDWVAGDLSVVDFAVASTFMFRGQAHISLGDLPHVTGWIERLEARPSWRKAVEPLLALMQD